MSEIHTLRGNACRADWVLACEHRLLERLPDMTRVGIESLAWALYDVWPRLTPAMAVECYLCPPTRAAGRSSAVERLH